MASFSDTLAQFVRRGSQWGRRLRQTVVAGLERALALPALPQSMEASEQRYENLFHRTPISIWQEDFTAVADWLEGLRAQGIGDLEGHLMSHPELVREGFGKIKVTNVNDATVELFEAPDRDRLIGQLDAASYRQEIRKSVVAQLVAVWDGRESFTTEFVGQTFSGRQIDLVLHWTAPSGRDGLDLSNVVVSMVDVSQLKATEREARVQLKLAQQERRLQIIAENSSDLLYTLDEAGVVVWVGKSVDRLLGYQRSDVLGHHYQDFVHPQDAHAMNEVGQSLPPGGSSAVPVHRIRHADGSWRAIEGTAQNMTDDELVNGWVIAARDVTDRLVAESTLRKSEGRFRLLAENSTDMISSLSPTGECLYVSPACQLLLGCGPEALVGVRAQDITHPEDQGRLKRAYRTALVEKRVVTVDSRMRVGLAPWRWFETILKPIYRSESTEVIRLHASTRDISDRKSVEAELLLAKEAAEAATESKSQFLANVSQEIRTPMNAILGMTELALGTDVSEEQREYLATTRTSIDALITLVNDLLDIAKIESGKLELELIPFSLSDTIADTVRTLAVNASEKGLELNYRVPPNLPDAVVGDPGRVRQILFNLVGNALKFTQEGQVEIGVEVEQDADEDVVIHVWVRDSGIGIPADRLETIFEAFTQADGATTRRFGGTGLGLSISMQLVKMMQGRLWVESELGVGSTFHFTARLARSHTEPLSAGAGSGDATTVLVLADTNFARRGIAESLQQSGRRTLLAGDLAGAFDVIFEAPLDQPGVGAIVIDVRTGTLELARRLMNEPVFEHLPVVVITPTGERGEAAMYRQAGIAGYLSKPVNPGELVEIVDAVSGAGRPLDELVTRHWLRARRPRLSVLVADDSPTNRLLAARLLEKRGHRATLVKDGVEAVNAALSSSFDAVLMDVQMPEMDGLEATTVIRQRQTRAIPIIGLTAHATAADQQRCLDSGMDAYVSKPFRPQELFAKLEELCGSPLDSDESVDLAGPGGPEILDRTEALELLGGMADVAVELVAAFQHEYPPLMDQIRQGFDLDNLDQVGRAAHQIKGSLALLAAHPAAHAAALVERHSRAGNRSNSETAWSVLQDEIRRLQPIIATLASSELAWA